MQIVDGSTGRIMPDRTWSDGNCIRQSWPKRVSRLTPDTQSLARITRQRFLRLLSHTQRNDRHSHRG